MIEEAKPRIPQLLILVDLLVSLRFPIDISFLIR
jgi:hypothetical protein